MSFPGHFEPDNESSAPRSFSYNASHRRPWSPISHDADITDTDATYDYLVQNQISGSLLHGKRQARRVQNASEDSVEALDLAEYARTLRGLTTEPKNPYPPFPYTSHLHPLSVPTPIHAGRQTPPFGSYPEYPPSPDNYRPFSVQSRETFSQSPPSLVSGDTSHDSNDSYGPHYPYPSRRPHSLPPFLSSASKDQFPIRGQGAFSPTSGASHHIDVRIASPVLDERGEADISRFPAFSRGWYDDPQKASSPKHTSLPPYSSELELQYGRSDSFTASDHARNILPWQSQLVDPRGPPVDDAVKKERIRMLEHEFGKKEKPGDNGEPVVGSVDEKGALITVGPKKRVGARWAQGILALATALSSLYGALFIKTPTPAPPASTAPAIALYSLSVITFFFVFYLFAIRPCCRGKRSKSTNPKGPDLAGMMVLPVQGLPGGKKKKNKKGRNNKNGGGDVQVNLIVDPSMFGGSAARDDEVESEGDYDVEGSQVSSRRRGGRSQAQQRRGLLQGLAMESDWNAARKFLKRMLFVDIACLVVWAGVFIMVLFGKRCPPGGFNGWCDSYNIASATACILCVAFASSVFFDIVDLHMSKASPRTRT